MPTSTHVSDVTGSTADMSAIAIVEDFLDGIAVIPRPQLYCCRLFRLSVVSGCPLSRFHQRFFLLDTLTGNVESEDCSRGSVLDMIGAAGLWSDFLTKWRM